MYRPDLEPDDLFETVGQCLLSSVDRDCMSGWGAVVHIITKDKVRENDDEKNALVDSIK